MSNPQARASNISLSRICSRIMVWISNQSGTCLNVSISSVHTSGGATGFYPVEHELETWAVNHWNRAAEATETAVVRLRNTSVTINDLKGNELLLVYSNSYIRVPDTVQVHFA